MEGYRSLPEGEHAGRVKRLRERVRARSRRRRLFYLPRIAAALLVLALLGAGFWYINQDPADGPVAMEEQDSERAAEPTAPATEKEAPASEEALAAGKEEIIAFSEERAEAEEPPPPATLQPAAEPPREDLAARAQKPEPKAEPAQEQQAANIAAAPEAAAEAPPPPAALRQAAPPAEGKKESTPQYYTTLTRPPGAPQPLQGVVLRPDGLPLPGAKVSVPGSQQATFTDHRGQFTLPLDSTPSEVIVQYEGFASFRSPVGQRDSLAIFYPEDAALSREGEMAKSRARMEESGDTKSLPEPRKGFDKLEKYIEKHLRYPEAARREQVEGEVKLSFYIQPDGSLTDFRTEESPGFGLGEEAIRLLKEGPKWEGAGQRATYTIRFELD